jgi:hypothetical protein
MMAWVDSVNIWHIITPLWQGGLKTKKIPSATTKKGFRMKVKDARALFPNHTINLDDIGVCVFGKDGGHMIAGTDRDTFHVSGAVRGAQGPDGRWQWDKAVKVQTWASVSEMKKALDATRFEKGYKPASQSMVMREWKKAQQQDFDQALILIANLLNGEEISPQHISGLTNAGRRLYQAQMSSK